MEMPPFDALLRSPADARTRRGVTLGLSGLVLGGGINSLLGQTDGDAKRKKKRKRNKKRCGQDPPRQPVHECPGPQDNIFSATGTIRTAQTFTASDSGSLRQIQVAIVKTESSGDYSLQLVRVFGSTPSNNPQDVLAAVTIPDATVPSGESMLTGDFNSPELVQGTDYAVVISRPESTQLRLRVRDQSGGRACSGQMFTASLGGPFSSGSSLTALDMIVSVFVD